MDIRGSGDSESVAELCQGVVDLMARIDEEDLVDALNSDNEVATGAMYARAQVMGLIELNESGVPSVRSAHEALADMVEVTDDDEDDDE